MRLGGVRKTVLEGSHMMDKETMPQTLGSSQEYLDRFLGPSSSLSCTPRNLCKEEKRCSMHVTFNEQQTICFML